MVIPFYPSEAARFSGEDMLRACAPPKEDGKDIIPNGRLLCQSYIAAIIDYHNFQSSVGNPPTVQYCVPKDVSLRDLQDIVYRHLYTNGQHDGFIAAPAVAMALYQAFPCK